MSVLYKITIVGLILFAVSSVFLSIPDEASYRTAADEGTYSFYATSVSKYGLNMIPEIGRVFVERENMRQQPTPLRVGHILAIASWSRIFSGTYVSLACFSCFCFVLFLIVCFFFSRTIFGEDVAYVFTLLLSSSPLFMAMGRRALSDTHGYLFCGLAVWLFMEFLRNRKDIVYVFFLISFSLSVLARESSLVTWPFFVTGLLAWKYLYKNDISFSYIAGIVVVPGIILITTYIFLFGGVSIPVGLFKILFKTHADAVHHPSQYGLLFCSGPWYRYLIDFIALSPITALLFIAYVGCRLMSRDMEWPIAYFAGYFVLIYAVFSCLKMSKIVRFVINLDMVIVLFATLYLWELFRSRRTEVRFHFVLIAAVAIFILNYANFIETFVVRDVYDPVSYDLLSVQKIIPSFNAVK